MPCTALPYPNQDMKNEYVTLSRERSLKVLQEGTQLALPLYSSYKPASVTMCEGAGGQPECKTLK